jgi:hypothetical protein
MKLIDERQMYRKLPVPVGKGSHESFESFQAFGPGHQLPQVSRPAPTGEVAEP